MEDTFKLRFQSIKHISPGPYFRVTIPRKYKMYNLYDSDIYKLETEGFQCKNILF